MNYTLISDFIFKKILKGSITLKKKKKSYLSYISLGEVPSVSAQVFDIKQKRHCCYIYQSETRMPILLGNSLSRTPLIYQYTAVSQPLPAGNATGHARQTVFSSFPRHLSKPNKSSLGQRSHCSQERDPNCSAQPYSLPRGEGRWLLPLKHYWKFTHTLAFCLKTGLHVSLSPFPAWSRSHDSPAGATSARRDLLLPRRPPHKACAWLPQLGNGRQRVHSLTQNQAPAWIRRTKRNRADR